MEPNIWGAETWKFLHLLTLQSNIPKQTLQDLFYHLQVLLPCEKCRNNYKRHIEEYPFPNNKKDIPKWLIQFHNRVNETISKPIQKEKDMLVFWKKQNKMIKTSKDTGIWFFIQCAINTHPGKAHFSEELLKAHQFFWANIDILLPTYITDRDIILTYLNEYPISDINIKYKYQKHMHKLSNHFNFAEEAKICSEYCAKK